MQQIISRFNDNRVRRISSFMFYGEQFFSIVPHFFFFIWFCLFGFFYRFNLENLKLNKFYIVGILFEDEQKLIRIISVSDLNLRFLAMKDIHPCLILFYINCDPKLLVDVSPTFDNRRIFIFELCRFVSNDYEKILWEGREAANI